MRGVESPKQWKRVPKAMAESDVRQLLDIPNKRNSPLEMRDLAICETLYSAAFDVTN